jgi:release factor glutamine methyltransferase
MALVTPDGFECYRALVLKSHELLAPGGVLAFELHADGAEVVGTLLKEHLFSDIRLVKDYSGLDRVLSGKFHE